MKGRDGRGSPRDQGQRGGKGSPGASGKGTIPSIGAYLDLPPGRVIVPGTVSKWMNKVKDYGMTQRQTDICAIFGPDGTIGDYPTFVEPADLEEPASSSAREKWKIRYNDYTKNTRLFTLDKSVVRIEGRSIEWRC